MSSHGVGPAGTGPHALDGPRSDRYPGPGEASVRRLPAGVDGTEGGGIAGARGQHRGGAVFVRWAASDVATDTAVTTSPGPGQTTVTFDPQ